MTDASPAPSAPTPTLRKVRRPSAALASAVRGLPCLSCSSLMRLGPMLPSATVAMAAKWALVWAAAISLGVAVTGCRDSYGASDAEPAETVVEQARYVETREVITRLANELMRANEVTGISLALVDGDEVVWATGFGLADVNHRISAGPRTVYNVGSLAKPVTVAAVLQAVERGELSLDQTLAELLPELDLAGD